jgi:hypothetical protein
MIKQVVVKLRVEVGKFIHYSIRRSAEDGRER